MFDLQQAIDDASHVTFLTGAGVSTASGIPDYRSKGGLYDGAQSPEYILSADNLRDHPKAFYAWVTANMYYPDAQPNRIHDVMAALTNRKGTIVTQNVDGLDRRAGAKHLVEYHGSLERVYCQTCHKLFSAAEYLTSMTHEEDGGILRPDIVLYGEMIPPQTSAAALAAVEAADLLILVGTSLQVYPFAGLIQAKNPQATLVAINREPLALPAGAHQVVGDAVTVFDALHV